MPDEAHEIELEAARVKLQREKLLLENALRNQQTSDAVKGAAKRGFFATVKISEGLLIFSLGAFIGLLFWLGAGAALAALDIFPSQYPDADFLWRTGFALRKFFPEIVLPLIVILTGGGALIYYYSD